MYQVNGGNEILPDSPGPNITASSISSSDHSLMRNSVCLTSSGVGDGAQREGPSDTVDPGYISDRGSMEKSSELLSTEGEKRYPENCLRFDFLSCAKASGLKLNKCYGEIYSGEVTAIMGPARSGRSTLLKILAGIKLKNCRGRIKIGNVDRTTQHFKKISCYIPHHLILSNLTVKETLTCSAIACCPPHYKDHERNKAILTVLEQLLSCEDDFLNRKVYDLTLVEQRILCLAAEYLRQPKFIFIQDPLRDLSIEHQLFYLQQIKILSMQKVAVVLCIKSGPSTATLDYLDKLLILSRGELAFSGFPAQLNLFFKDASHDPTFPDIHLVLKHCAMSETRRQIEDNKERNRRAIDGAENHVTYEPAPKSCVQHTLQGFSMCSRYSIALARQMRAVAYRLIYNTLLGLLMGGICFEVGKSGLTARENAGYIFFCILFLFIGSMVASARRTSRYMCIYQREKFNRWYSSFSFYLAKMLAELPVEIIMSVPYASITYFMAGNPANLVYFVHISLCVVTACMGHVFGVVIMAVSEKFEIQQAVAGGYITLNTVFMGYMFRVRFMPMLVKWAAVLSPFHMLFKCFIINIYNSKDPLTCPSDPVNCTKFPPNLLYLYGFEGEVFELHNYWYLLAHLAFMHAAAFVCISSRGRWFDSELPRANYNKCAVLATTIPSSPLPQLNVTPVSKPTTRQALTECFRNCITCKPYKPIQVGDRDKSYDTNI